MNDEELRLEAQAFEAAARALMNGFAGLPDHREPQDWVRISHALDGGAAGAATCGNDRHLSLTELPAALLRHWWPGVSFDVERVSCLRACLMKPAHREWIDQI